MTRTTAMTATSAVERPTLRLPVALLDRRERVEVALDGADELLVFVLGRDDSELLLALLPVAITPRSGSEAPIEARLFDRDG
jgi:hypothetical protein